MDHKKSIGRRGILKAAGIAAGGALLGACEHVDPFEGRPRVPGEPAWPTGESTWLTSTCGQCHAGCGIRVRVLDGRANHVAGNPDSPINGTGVGPKGHAGLQVLYHPDRIRTPLRRVGERGEGKWEEVSWDRAIAGVGGLLRAIRAEGPEGLVLVDGQPRGPMQALWSRFLEAYGSPNHVDHRAATDGGKVLAMKHMQGVAELPAYDWTQARYVIGFGAGFFESWCQTIHFIRAAKHVRTENPGRRTKFVIVAPRFSVTAAKSDEFVAIEPGTYGALALGIAHVLVRDRRFDEEFVRDHTHGFDAWTDPEGRAHRGFRDLLEGYPPERVAAITKVPSDTIARLAHEMADNRPAISFADGGAAAATNGLGTAMAIHALNALLGNLERPGGLLVQRQAALAAWPPPPSDAVARSGMERPRLDGAGTSTCPLGASNIIGLPRAIIGARPYAAKALLLYRSNPGFSKPGGRKWIEAMRRVPLVVSFSPLPDESTVWADWVLPDHTYLETWDVVEPAPAMGYPVLGLRRPVVAPLYDTMATGDVVLRLARTIGGSVAEAFPWAKYRDAVRERLAGLAAAATPVEGEDTAREVEDRLVERGTWSAMTQAFEQWEHAFRTPSGKFELYSHSIAAKLREAYPSTAALDAALERRGVATRGDDLCLPHWEPPKFAGEPEEFPFVLVAYRGIEYAEGGARHVPFLRELPLQGLCSWYERIEINPADAKRLGIGVYEWVAVESPAARGRFRAHHNPTVAPGTLALPLGHGPWPPRPGIKRQVGGYALLADATDPLAGILALQGTRARIRRIES